MEANESTFVTAPSLGSISEFSELLQTAWDSGILTHNGPIVQQLEREVSAFLGLNELVAVTNGTIGLQVAIKALELSGDIITTPFSWIATCSAIKWERCTPIFVDIDPATFNIDPSKIEEAITDQTVAIMPVHVFSNPCEVEQIADIANRHGLKVIYDGAHAFGVDYSGRSLLTYGDISTLSFHATKLFNTGEGGACYAPNASLMERLRRLRFFGHDESKDIVEDGCNAKLTEIHAALGLANMRCLERTMSHRRLLYDAYFSVLGECPEVTFQRFPKESYNYSYMPIVFRDEAALTRSNEILASKNIFARRYFYPSLNTLAAVRSYQSCPLSEDLTNRILCLPSHDRVTVEQAKLIGKLVRESL